MDGGATVVTFVLLLASCGKNTIVPSGAEKSVADTVTQHTQFHLRPSAVKCPDGIEAKPGITFTCHFTGPAGQRYDADMRVMSVKGTKVVFYINTRRGG
jgi:hypothetical protein